MDNFEELLDQNGKNDGETEENTPTPETVEPTSVRPETSREKRYVLPPEIASDLEQDPYKKGWLQYWRERLKNDPEANKLGWHGQSKISPSLLTLLHRLAVERSKNERILEQRMHVMRELARRLTDIDAHVDYPEDERLERSTIKWDAETKQLYVVNEQDQRFPFELHDINSDMDWGRQYRPDGDVPEDIWRSIRKRADIATARTEIEQIYNDELSKIEGFSVTTTAFDGEWIEKKYKEGRDTGLHGVISERMAKNALRRMASARKDIGLKVENSNIFEDAELKYDFKIAVNVFSRGVATEPEGLSRAEYVTEKRSLGVQFAAGKGGGKLTQVNNAKKLLGSERVQNFVKHQVDDIVLVKLDLRANERYGQWLADGKPPGGPERYMTEDEKTALLNAVLVSKKTHGSAPYVKRENAFPEQKIQNAPIKKEVHSKHPGTLNLKDQQTKAKPENTETSHQEQAIINLRKQLGL